MKKILYLSFYFEPDLCAGSFRNTPLAKMLADKVKGDVEVHVFTTMPNRYNTYHVEADKTERFDNLSIYRIELPKHSSGFKDQIISFKSYLFSVLEATKGQKYDYVFASSSRLFTALLGSYYSRKYNAPLFLDIRDIFKETIEDVLNNKLFKVFSSVVFTVLEKYTFGRAKAINLVSGGFKSYFENVAPKSELSYFPNGIDDVFLNQDQKNNQDNNGKVVITYAGNIGSGQGLEKTLPQAAKELGDKYTFQIIGAGGTISNLRDEIKEYNVSNVNLIDPVNRQELVSYYNESDVLFLQLNDLDAFKKVLPSKVFEYGASVKPIVAGIAGYSAKFLKDNVPGSYIYKPGDWRALVGILRDLKTEKYDRVEYRKKYSRTSINEDLTNQILKVFELENKNVE